MKTEFQLFRMAYIMIPEANRKEFWVLNEGQYELTSVKSVEITANGALVFTTASNDLTAFGPGEWKSFYTTDMEDL